MEELTLAATVENIGAATAFVTDWLEELGCSMKMVMQFSIAVDELFANIAHYAYQEGAGMVTLQLDVIDNGGKARVTFIDQGTPYNPLEKQDPDITLSAEDRPIGGLGIFMVKKSMDDMTYRYENGQNMLSIIKTIA